MTVQSELTSAVPHVTRGLRPGSGGADPCAAPVATRWTAHDHSLEESALAGAAVCVARNLAADLMGTGISFVLAGADGRELGRFAESEHELDTLDAAVPPTAGHWAGPAVDAWDGPDGALPPGPPHNRRRVTRLLRSGGRLKARRPGWLCWSGPGMSRIHSWSRSPAWSPATSSSRCPSNSTRRAELLTQAFSSRRRSPRPLVVVGPDTVWANAAANQCLGLLDAGACGISRNRLCTASAARRRCRGPGGQFRVTAEAIRDREDVVGAVLCLATLQPVSRPALGWESLTATEKAVSELVASGQTNREVGRELLMSPHTVDAHLRHIFAKLDVNSRVDLARLAGETHAARSHDAGVIVAVARSGPPAAARHPARTSTRRMAASRLPFAGGRSGGCRRLTWAATTLLAGAAHLPVEGPLADERPVARPGTPCYDAQPGPQ